jgi:LmbE family N-acetylglucosaminyl deacetylase
MTITMAKMCNWIFISPHLDDVVLSCGGLIAELVHLGIRVEIWTVFAGDPPPGQLTPFAQSLHDRWGTGTESVQKRREEDEQACALLNVKSFHFAYPDCIYRYTTSGQPVIKGEDDLFQKEYGGEEPLVEQLCAQLQRCLPSNAAIAAPYAIGGHIDHQVVVRAAQKLGREIWT